MPLNIDLNIPLDDVNTSNNLPNMPLNIDLNAPPNIDLSSSIEEEDHIVERNDTHNVVQTFPKKRCFLDNSQWDTIFQVLINSSVDGKIKRGVVKQLAFFYQVSIDVIYRIWKRAKESGVVSHKKTKNYGQKRVELDIEKMRNLPLVKRSTIRSLAFALETSPRKIGECLKKGILRRHSSALKPHMTEDNMKSRLKFCLSMLEESNISYDPKFQSMYNIVHIDEKWFYMTQKNKNYYLLSNEDEPYRSCKNKNFIMKVMFLVAVARPRFDNEGNETWSGKIGVFPLVDKVPAKRSSVNRPSGTLETKPITSITKEVSRMFLINKVLPAIKEKWPREYASEPIYIQQDNAPCHVSINNEEFLLAASEGGFDIRLICQPPNSPDLNILDLGFFSAIQALQQKNATKTVDELIQVVQNSYDAFSSVDSNKIFLTLQSCMIEIMKVRGSNNYKIPHIKKDVMLRQAILPAQLNCEKKLVEEVIECLQN
ncbi:hypothetical protein KIW84_072209 [Lathyrus oleraceus]|uniref:DUF7769 domain-containing protein n=1 Tax=Pisum sativum TaxID=3888 RepID=A0A9D4ZUT2_PEA|nr:hypothetical protein KIW84_072209 [Pisum sativum]